MGGQEEIQSKTPPSSEDGSGKEFLNVDSCKTSYEKGLPSRMEWRAQCTHEICFHGCEKLAYLVCFNQIII